MATKDNETIGIERTIIIAGINGDLGQEFARSLKDHGRLYGISRGRKKTSLDYTHICADLLISEDVGNAFRQIRPSDNIIYVHLPGKFRFEDVNHPITDKNRDGIDDEIYDTNVRTFKTVRPVLLNYLETNLDSNLKIVGIGSACDIYDIPFWKSFTHSKNELRKEFRLMYGNSETCDRVSSLFINVSTVTGTQLCSERPFYSREFCLTPSDVVNQSLPYMLDNRHSCLEMSVIKPNPEFMNPNYLCPDEIRERWYRDMYGHSNIRR